MNTINLAIAIANCKPQPGEVALFWLGQAGFLMKDSRGRRFVIDPYLTDCGERFKGFKRVTPKLLAPEDLKPDLYLITHHHFDHFDYDAVPVIAAGCDALFCAPESCVHLLLECGLDRSRIVVMEPGKTIAHAGIQLTATPADHGDMAPDAVGAVVEMDDRRIYFSGDTAYHPEYVPTVTALRPEFAALSINGKFGNLTAEEGARYARELGVDGAIPCHFWTFIEHEGHPLEFVEALKQSGACRPLLMHQGEMLLLKRSDQQ